MRWHGPSALAAAVATAALIVPAAPAPAQAAPLVRIPVPADDGSLTPYTFSVNYPLVTLVYDTLTWRDARGVPRPWLARSIRRSADKLTVTIRLRHGARWHDGVPVTAADVAFTFRYVATHRQARFTPQLRDIASVRARGRDTVVLHLRRPSLGLLDQPLADVPILPEHLWANLPEGRTAPAGPPIGSGPYRLVRHVDGRAYHFQAVKRYYRGRPTVDHIDAMVLRQADRTSDALAAGKIDAAPLNAGDPDPDAQGIDVLRGPSFTGTVLMFNTRAPPFNRLDARRAVADALEPRRIAAAIAGPLESGGADAADGGYLSPRSSWAPRLPLHHPDLTAARIALAEEGVGRIDVLAGSGNPVAVEAGRQVVLALERSGADARLLERPAAAVARAVGQDGAPATFTTAIWSTPALASFDPAFLRPLFGSGEALNYPAYRSAQFDALAAEVDDAPDDFNRRRAVTAELERLALGLPVVPLFYARTGWAFRTSVFRGWRFVKGTGALDKQSFLGGERSTGTASSVAVADPADRSQGSDFSLLPFVIGALAILGAAAIAFALRSRRSR